MSHPARSPQAPKDLISIRQLTRQGVEEILRLSDQEPGSVMARRPTCVVSIPQPSIRTRTAVAVALDRLGVHVVEAPALLDSDEPVDQLAGYLDQWVDLYVVRTADHTRIAALAAASERPVINAMSADEHPTEVISDACHLRQHFGSLDGLRLGMVGQPTNVLRSWCLLAECLGLDYRWAVPPDLVEALPSEAMPRATSRLEEAVSGADVILTDAWDRGPIDRAFILTGEVMTLASARAVLLPCPPFTKGREHDRSIIDSGWFTGFGQKRCMCDVVAAIVRFLLDRPGGGREELSCPAPRR